MGTSETHASRRLFPLSTSADSDMPPQPIDADIDTNKDGLVSRESFSKLVDMAASIPRMYGYVPTDVELYKTEDEKEQARRKTFDFMDFKGTDVITVDEWFKFCVEHIIAKAATFAAHPILDHGSDHTEMYWFLLELFTESDLNENGIVIITNLSQDEMQDVFSTSQPGWRSPWCQRGRCFSTSHVGWRSSWSQGGRRRGKKPRNYTTLHCRAVSCIAACGNQKPRVHTL